MSRRHLYAVLIAGLVLSAIVLIAVSVGAQQGECPNPQLIDEIQLSGTRQTPPFQTTTNSFRISYDIRADMEEAPFFLRVEHADEEQGRGPVANVSEEGSGSGETFANAPPGRYFLDINTTGGTESTIRIEECGEGGQADPKEGAKGEPKAPLRSKLTRNRSKSRVAPPRRKPIQNRSRRQSKSRNKSRRVPLSNRPHRRRRSQRASSLKQVDPRVARYPPCRAAPVPTNSPTRAGVPASAEIRWMEV